MKNKKTGGRAKGTPNRTTALTKSVIADLLTDYHNSGLMSEDFKALKANDRMVIAERLMQYVMPKMQSASVDLASERVLTIEEQLIKLSGMDE